jgi:hypothetical protein
MWHPMTRNVFSQRLMRHLDPLASLLKTKIIPDDRDPETLPPLSVRETERYAYIEDDFDAYLGFHYFRDHHGFCEACNPSG